jgi:Xaa-Pro dipeptidase
MLHFPPEEFAERVSRTRAAMDAAGLDGLVLFRQESMFYLTGYDTSGYTMFQALYLGADGQLSLLTRTADRIQARETSTIKDIHIWVDQDGASPGDELRRILQDHGCANKRVGIEYHAYGLTGQRALMVNHSLEGFCQLIDASDLVRLVRLVKSRLELEYIRQSGQICNHILQTSIQHTRPGTTVKTIYGAMLNTLLAKGGDPTASRWPMGAGEAAVFCRYHTGDETIAPDDQIVFEPAAAYRHYHTCMMYNILTGVVDPHHRAMNEACCEALDSCQDVLRSGNTVGSLHATHERIMKVHGFSHATLSACGYSVGISYPPTWMDWPMIWQNNPQIIEPGMVFFLHMILLDDHTGLSMCAGETAIVTDGACERVNQVPRQIIHN